MIRTDLQIKLPEGCYSRITTRTNLAYHHICIGEGVIDQDFRGNLSMLLYNHSENPYHIHHGDKIAELICEKIYCPELDNTWRDAQGFRSTGQN